MYEKYINKPDILNRYVYKILLIMRLTTVIIITTILQVSASSFAQKFSYVKREVSLSQIFSEIKKQTGYSAVWNSKVDVSLTVDANFKKAPIEEVLEQCLSKHNLIYKIENKTISIKPKEASFRDKLIGLFTLIDVRGRVVDENNEPLIGAVVKIKGTSIATSTNSKGEFSLTNVDDQAILVISFLGYEPQEITVTKNMGEVKLVMAEDRLKEVEINAGYYKVTDRERTGSISRITSKDIERQPVNNVLQAMQANIPGVQVTQSTGVPGGGFTVQIRGRNSISQGNDPFYIVDGIPFTALGIMGSRAAAITPNANPLASINPADIQSIEVLKDADATAIYGSRGANGVILITTKKGQIGKSRASISINQGISTVYKNLDLMNTAQYLEMRKEALSNDKINISTTDYDLNGTWNEDRDIDWQKELIGGSAPTTNILASLSGGLKNVTYLIGGAYYKEGTVFPGNSSYGRKSGNFSLNYTSDNKKFNISFDANYSQVNSDLFTTDLTQYITLAPNYPALVNEYGMLNWQNNTVILNPIANTERPYDSTINNLIGNTVISYNVLSDLKVKVNMGYTKMDRKEFSSDPLKTYSPALNYGPDRRLSFFTNNSTDNWIVEPQVDWNAKYGSSKISLLFGSTFQQSLYDGQEIRGAGYASDALMSNIAAASSFTIPRRYYNQYRYTAFYGRINYILNDKYIINATGRRDGSTRFGPENRFANFGAIGAAWIVSEEHFFKKGLSSISLMKLRGSFGVTGNDLIGDYGYLNLWNSLAGTYQGISTLIPSQLANANYSWEVNKKAEMGLELGVLKNAVNLSINYYYNKSSSQLVSTQLAPSTGFSSIRDNLPATVENKGLEFEINSSNISKNNFVWRSSVNLTMPKNKLLDYPGLKTSGDASIYEIGQPLSIKKLWNTYIDPQTGLLVREDYDQNGIVDARDQYLIKFIGRKLYGGIQNSFRYKQFELDFLFQFVKQNGSHYLSGFNLAGGYSTQGAIFNQPVELESRWRNVGDIAPFQKFGTTTVASTNSVLEKSLGGLAVSDASFIRLKNIAFTYNFPQLLTQKLKINSIKFFLQAQNLITITNYKGLDPETLSTTRLPSLRVVTAGLRIEI